MPYIYYIYPFKRYMQCIAGNFPRGFIVRCNCKLHAYA